MNEKFVCCKCGIDLHIPYKSLDEKHLCGECKVATHLCDCVNCKDKCSGFCAESCDCGCCINRP
jgi:hypothetical protein